jgi:hypothetical protein
MTSVSEPSAFQVAAAGERLMQGRDLGQAGRSVSGQETGLANTMEQDETLRNVMIGQPRSGRGGLSVRSVRSVRAYRARPRR